MFKPITALLLILLSFTKSNASVNIDSINSLIQSSRHDTSSINKLNELLSKSITSTDNHLKIYLESVLKITDSIKYNKGKAYALLNLAEYSKNNSNFPTALDYCLKALPNFEISKEYKGLITCYNKMGVLNSYQRKTDIALENFNQALELSKKWDANEIKTCYNNLAVVYMNTGSLDKALDLLLKSLKLESEQNYAGKGKALTNIGYIYRSKGQFEEALKYQNKALDNFNKSNLIAGKIMALTNIAICHAELGNFNAAISTNKELLKLAHTTGDKENLANAYFGFYNVYKMKGDYKNALESFEQLSTIKDSIFTEQNARAFNELQTKYETEKKEKQIIILNKEKQIQELTLQKINQQKAIAYALFILLLIASVILYFYYRTKQAQKLRETILNTEITERTRIAKDMHDELGASLTKILVVSEVAKSNTSNTESLTNSILTINKTVKELSSGIRDFVWTLNPENASLENLMVKLREFCTDMLDEALIDSRLDIADEVPAIQISKKSQRNIYLACKESINNIIKHANATEVIVKSEIEQGQLQLEIKDNGKGFVKENLKTAGHGLHNIIKRIEDIGGSANINSLPGEGTFISISLALKELEESPKSGMN